MQGIRSNHIIVHKKSGKFFHCAHVESRSTIFGKRSYYYCRSYTGFLSTYWFNEEDIRPVNESEADAATGWILAARIADAMGREDSRSERDEMAGKTTVQKKDWPKCIDLFSGAGGFTLGMAWAGCNVVGHVEHSDMCLETYECNKERGGFENSELIGKDITAIPDDHIKAFREKHGHIHCIVGGPPCQGFSTSGKRDPKDPRNSLFIHFVRFCRIIEPDVFIMENVPGMKSMRTAKGENCLQIILQAFKEVGYSTDWAILNAANYGVPQTRRRIIIYGMRNGKIPTFPLPTHFDKEEGKKASPPRRGEALSQINQNHKNLNQSSPIRSQDGG